jgi:hypothetical protein
MPCIVLSSVAKFRKTAKSSVSLACCRPAYDSRSITKRPALYGIFTSRATLAASCKVEAPPAAEVEKLCRNGLNWLSMAKE